MGKFMATNKVYINGKEKLSKDLSLEELKLLFKEYKNKYGKFPNSIICMNKDRDNLPSWHAVENIYKSNNMTLNEFLIYIGNYESIKPDINKYDEYIKIVKEECFKQNKVLECRDFIHNSWSIPEVRWLINNCPDKSVTDYNKFIEWLGFIPSEKVSKEVAIKAIYSMAEKLNRPLMYDDFRNPKFNEIGYGTINKIWGTMNKMKQELGLEIIQEDMVSKHISLGEAKEDIIKLCDFIYKTENRKVITGNDTSLIEGMLDFSTYRNYFRDNNENIREYIRSIGFELQKEGQGLTYIFDDGECTKSRYELEFSKYLRDVLHLKYSADYFRDIKYKTFINNYSGLMDCDYIIKYKDEYIYIEIAGILRDLHKYYYEDTPISSKSKEKYRLKLKEKERLLKSLNDIQYYIIFPINKNYKSTLDFDYINKIFNINE